MLRLFSHFKPFFATSFFFLTLFRPCMYRRSALSYFRSGLPYAAASLQCARYDTKLKKIQIWQDFKGRGLKSQSLKGLAFIKGEITAIHQQIMYSCLYRVQNFEILTEKHIQSTQVRCSKCYVVKYFEESNAVKMSSMRMHMLCNV